MQGEQEVTRLIVCLAWGCRLPRLAALSVDMHPAPLVEADDGESASAAPLQPWAGGPVPPLGLCRLPTLTELDFSLRAFASPAISVPEVGGSLGSPPVCTHASASVHGCPDI